MAVVQLDVYKRQDKEGLSLPRLKLLVLPLLLIFALTGCSLLWPSVNNTPEQPDLSPYTSGSFMPEIIPTAGEETRLRTVYLLDHANRYLVDVYKRQIS